MRRAGLDYHEWADVRSYDNWDVFINKTAPANLYTFSTKAKKYYTDVSFLDDDYLVFGPETRGLPQEIREVRGMDNCLRLPMLQDSRSMNLSNAVSVIVYEGWRQLGFKDGC